MTDSSTRQLLVEAARDLFLLQGYHNTGVAEIVRTANARMGSLYYYFPTKEDLLIAVLEWYRDHIHDDLLKPVFDRIDDPIERIFGVLDGYRQMLLLSAFDQGCPIGNLSLEITNSHPKARELLIVNFRQWRDEVHSCLDAAQGRLPEEVDRQSLADHILAVMEGAVMLARTHRSIEPYDSAIAHLRDYLDRILADGTFWSAQSTGRRAIAGDPAPHPQENA